MIISHSHRFIFVKSRKTAGTSLEMFLSRFCSDRDVITRVLPSEQADLARIGGRAEQNMARRPGIDLGPFRIRSPFSLGREYTGHMRADKIRDSVPARVWRDYLKFTIVRNPYDRAISLFFSERAAADMATVNRYIENEPPERLTNWRIYTDRNGEVIVDRFLRYETLAADVAALLPVLGIVASVDLPHAKGERRTNREHYSRVLTAAARDRIATSAARELAEFDYRWEED